MDETMDGTNEAQAVLAPYLIGGYNHGNDFK